jgi:antirestriction protein ArdC
VRCYAALTGYLDGRGATVQSEDDGGNVQADGWYRPGTREIFVRPAAPAKMVKTLIHEAAHHLADGQAEIRAERAAEEVIAESIAFVVCDAVGIDAGAFSTDYIASWLRADPEGFRKGQAFIADAARELLAALDAGDEQADAGDTIAA